MNRFRYSIRPIFGVFALLVALVWSIGPTHASDDAGHKSAESVQALITAINAKDLNGVMGQLSDDIVYKNTGLPSFRGKPAVQAFLTPVFSVLSNVQFDVIDILYDKGVVMVRRIDTVDVPPLFGAPARHLEIPVMGYFQVDEEGKITLWADYFDTYTWDTETGLPLPKQLPPDNVD